MIETETDCAHLSVDMEPHPTGDGDICTHWVCRDCSAEFVPAEVVGDAEEHMAHLVEATQTLWLQYQRTRHALFLVVAVVVGFIIGNIF